MTMPATTPELRPREIALYVVGRGGVGRFDDDGVVGIELRFDETSLAVGHGLVRAARPQSRVVSCIEHVSESVPYQVCIDTLRMHWRAVTTTGR